MWKYSRMTFKGHFIRESEVIKTEEKSCLSDAHAKAVLVTMLCYLPSLFLQLGAQTSFTFELPNHKLCFQSKVSPVDMSTIPPSASLTLPPVTMSGEYIMEEHESHSDQVWATEDFLAKPGNYLQGNYLRCVAEVNVTCFFNRTVHHHNGQTEEPLLFFNSSPLICRLVHLSTTWPQTYSTTWSSCRRFSWRRSMRSFRRSQVLNETHI